MWTALLSFGLDFVMEHAKPIFTGLGVLIGGLFMYSRGKKQAKQEAKIKGLEEGLDANLTRKEVAADVSSKSDAAVHDELSKWRRR